MPLGGGGGAGGALGGIGGAVGGIIGLLTAGRGGVPQYQEAVDLWRKIEDPNFDFSQLSFPELMMVAELSPQTFDAFVPPEVKEAADSPELRAAQARGLARMEQIATEGYSTPERIAAQGAGGEIQREGTRLRDQALSLLAQKGRSYGGDVLQAQLGGSQQAMGLANQLGTNLYRYGADRMGGAAAGAAGLAGQVRGQDFGQRQAAVDAINRRNEYLANLFTNTNQANAAARERAQAYNVGTGQNLATQSQLGRYGTSQFNLTYPNTLRQTLFGDTLARTQGLTGALGNLGNVNEAQRLEKIMAAQGIGQGVGQGASGLLGLL